MSARRLYKVGVRLLGPTSNICFRRRAYATREAAFEGAATLLGEFLEGQKNPADWDATVFGPDADLITGRIVRHDGTQADLMETVLASSKVARDSLHAGGWTDEDIERGRQAR